MAKIDTANEIVEEFPNKGFDAEQLKEENTQEELDQLQQDLRAEREGTGDKTSEPSETPAPEASAAPAKESAKKYKLKDPETSYQEVGFTLADDQEKELPENPSSFLLGYIRSGFIVEVK
ncbi:hypothetical protein [Planococcus halotolerans]|uniref:Uncharacterized protein n=1 Tax=Planococcus halotolerans TaxID=2233542 RepID=A0A365KKF6_9BACL|nr:hypothetical protein [Planococcus halotolerans]RAZ73625.1 hypothetical protein DP120_16960 [Planococcus halotolerans]